MAAIKKTLRAVMIVGLFVLFIFLVEHYLPAYYHRLFLLFGINSILTVALNITNGFTGLFSLGHGGLMLVGGYAAAYFTLPVWWKAAHLSLPSWLTNTQLPFVVALLIGGIVAVVFGFVLTAPSFRLKGHYFMLMTLGFNIVMISLGENLITWTNGARGITMIPRYTNIWWVFGILAVLVYFSIMLKRSKLGRILITVGKDQVLAEAVGINPSTAKAIAFAISSFFTGIGGVLLVHLYGNLFPHNFGLDMVFNIVMMLIIGGMGSVTGSIIGAAIVTCCIELLSPLQEGIVIFGYRMPKMFGLVEILFAAIVIIILATRPQGIMGENEITCKRIARLWTNFIMYLRRTWPRR